MKLRVCIVILMVVAIMATVFVVLHRSPEYTDESLGRPFVQEMTSDRIVVNLDDSWLTEEAAYFQYSYRKGAGMWHKTKMTNKKSAVLPGFSEGDEVEVKAIGYDENHRKLAESDTVTIIVEQ